VRSRFLNIVRAEFAHPTRTERSRRPGDRGFTILEVQVAVLLLVLALTLVLAQGTNQQRHLTWVEGLGKAHGVVDVANQRVILAVAEPRAAETLPACKLRLLALSESGSYADAEVEIWSNVISP